MSSTTRTTRTADASLDEESNAKPKTFMDKWTEPPLRAPAPSFKEYPHLDIVRHGVLAEMAPLGQMPSSKLKKAAKSDAPKQFFQVKKPEPLVEVIPRDAVTPEPINYVRRRSESRKTDDVEYMPKTPKDQTSPQKSVGRPSTGRHSQTRQSSPSMSMSMSPIKQESELYKTDRVVDSAVKAALLSKKYPTAYALRTLYDEHRENPRVTALFIAVYSQTCTAAEAKEFSRLMKFKKREGKADDKAIKYFAEQGVNPFTISNIFSPSYSLTSASKRPGDLGLLRSPHMDLGHVSKKHKGNNFGHYESPFAAPPAMNGQGNNLTVDNLNQQNQNQINNGIVPGIDLARSKSHSTSSSLSSIDEELLRENFAPSAHPGGGQGQADGNTTNSKDAEAKALHPNPKATENNHAAAQTPLAASNSNSTQQHQPMTHQKALGPKLHAFPTTTTAATNSNPSSSSTPIPTDNNITAESAENTISNDNTMPAYLTDPLPSTFQQPPQNSLKSQKKQIGRQIEAEIDRDRLSLLKRQAKKVTEHNGNPTLSWSRGRFSTQDPDSETEGNHLIAVVPPPVKLRLRGKRKANDESDDLSSPTQFSFQADGPPGSTSNSRAGTPNPLGRPARKAKSGGLRTKTSPMKNKAGPSAGIPRASGERNSPVANGVNGQEDNDDYCSSCGGNGDLVCCDGCTRSFHFKCVDPPMIEGQLPDTWYCNVCNVSRHPITEESGSFGELLAKLDMKNPSAFHLPNDVRDYFEGVRTGTEGEYEEGPVASAKAKRHATSEETTQDYYLRLKDGKGNWILCHECGHGSGTDKPIIQCNYCSLSWHLDCLDPPLANPPNPPHTDRKWRCPCHVDELLAKVPGVLGPAHRFRRIKGASVVKPAISRGVRNNGHIDVEMESSDEEQEDAGFFQQKEYGHIYKLPEDGIKLDFLSRARKEHETATQALLKIFPHRRSLNEQQAALNLAQLAYQATPRDSDVQPLIAALMAEAPQGVIDLIAQGVIGGPSKRDKATLLAMKALLDRMIVGDGDGGDDGTPDAEIELVSEDTDVAAVMAGDETIGEGESKDAANDTADILSEETKLIMEETDDAEMVM